MRRLLRYLVVTFFAFALLGGIAAGVAYLYLAPTLPPVNSLRDVDYQVPLRVFSADDKLIAEFGERRRVPVEFDEVPPDLRHAFIAAEDQRFYEHPGVDYQGILRAIWYLVRTGEKGPGGSTITMQVARNFFLTRERTYLRKAREMLLALKIERELSKEQILQLYLNKIYLGQRAYGVGAAARVYYGVSVKDLTLAQMAMIAGLPKAPSGWNPIANPTRALERRGYVLGRMLDQGFINKTRYDKAMAAPITASAHEPTTQLDAPYVAEMARQAVVDRYGEDKAYTNGYTVHTTVDSSRQKAANSALRLALHQYDERHGWRGPVDHVDLPDKPDLGKQRKALADYPRSGDLDNALVLAVKKDAITVLSDDRDQPWDLPFSAMSWARPHISLNAVGKAPEKPSDVVKRGDVIHLRQTDDGPRLAQVPQPEGAIVSIDPADGHVIALVGGYDFSQSKFNRVTQAERQPGSSFKPFVYSAALANGFTAATIVNDAPVVFQDKALESTWRPENYSGKFFGPTRLRVGLIHSRNLVSIRVLRRIGVSPALKYLKRFGFDPDKLPHNLSLALGAASIKPIQLASGYAVFANGGHRVDPWVVQRIEDEDGQVLFRATPRVACPETCPNYADGSGGDSAAPKDASTDTDTAAGATDSAAGGADAAKSAPAQQTSLSGGPAPRVLPADNAWIVTSMMRDVIRHGTGRKALKLGRSDLAGKTGTTNDQRDAWFGGFDHAMVTVAWVGFDKVQSLGRYETGAKAALPMWMAYMGKALKNVPEIPLDQPDGLVTVRIDSDTGRVTTADNPDAIFETFRVGHVPPKEASGGTATTASDGGAEGGGGGSGGDQSKTLF
ncbi:MAG TPA: penicillin-binding protein 1A [Gammaproteobacteria bacterium]|nr:penicillin-binding protein 1A [Gammaproteobacteria bacterium]